MVDNVTKVILAGENRTGAMFSEFQRGLSGAESASNKLKSTLGALGITLTAAGFASMVKGSIDAADHLNDLSKTTGIAVTDLAGLKLAAKQSGTDLDGVAKAVSKLSVEIGKDGEAFAKLGIKTKDPLEALKQLSDIFVSIEDPQQRAAFAAKALGKGWQEIAPLLAEGGDSIGKAVAKGKELSKITEELAARSDIFNDRMEVMNARLNGVGAGIANKALPALNEWLGVVDKLIEKHGLLIGGMAGIGAAMASAAGQPITELGIAEKNASEAFADLANARKALAQAEKSSASDYGSGSRRDAIIAASKKQVEAYTAALRQANIARDALLDKPKDETGKGKPAATSADLKGFIGGEAKSTASEYDRIALSIARLTAEISAEDAALSPLLKTEKLALDLMVDIGSGKSKLTIAQKISTVAALEEAINKEKLAAATKKSALEREKEQKKLADENEARWKNIDALDTEIKSLEYAGQEIGLNVEQLNALKLARLDAALATKEHTLAVEEATTKGGSNVDALKIEIEQLKKVRDLTASNQGKQAVADIAKANLDTQVSMWQSIDKTAHDTFVSIANGGKDTWTRLKETGKNIFFDWLYSMTMKKWLVNISTSVSGAGVASQAFGAGNVASTGSSALSMASNASSIYGAFSGGYSAVAADAIWSETAVAGLGEVMQGSVMAGIESGLAAIPGWGWVALGALAIFAASSKGGGPKTEGSFSGLMGSDGSLVGGSQGLYSGHSADAEMAQMAPGIGKAIGDTIRGLGGSAAGLGIGYGYNTDPQGTAPDNVATTLTGANGEALYRNVRNVDRGQGAAALGDDLTRLTLAAIQSVDLGPILNPLLDGLGDVGAMTKEQVTSTLAALSSIGPMTADKFIQVFGEAFDIGKFTALATTGENVVQTFGRLASEFTATSAVAEMLGKDASTAFGSVGLASAAMRQELIAGAGGIANLTAQATSYYQTYFSETERTFLSIKSGTEQVTGAFAEMGIAVPATTEQFRSLVSGLDLGTSAGQTMYQALMNIAPTFANITTAAANMASSMAQSIATLNGIDANAYGLQAARMQVSSDWSSLQALAPWITSLDQLKKIDPYGADFKAYSPAAQAAIVKTLSSEANLYNLQHQQSAAQPAYSAFVDKAQSAASQLIDAWQSVTDSIFSEVARIRGLMGAESFSSAQANFAIATAQARAGDIDAARLLPSLSQSLLGLAAANAGTALDLAMISAKTSASLETTGITLGKRYGTAIPHYAAGGDHGGGWAMVGEEGPELVNLSPGRVYTNRDSGRMLDNSELIAEVQKLRAEVASLRKDSSDTASTNKKIADLLLRVTRDGDSLVTVAA